VFSGVPAIALSQFSPPTKVLPGKFRSVRERALTLFDLHRLISINSVLLVPSPLSHATDRPRVSIIPLPLSGGYIICEWDCGTYPFFSTNSYSPPDLSPQDSDHSCVPFWSYFFPSEGYMCPWFHRLTNGATFSHSLFPLNPPPTLILHFSQAFIVYLDTPLVPTSSTLVGTPALFPPPCLNLLPPCSIKGLQNFFHSL